MSEAITTYEKIFGLTKKSAFARTNLLTEREVDVFVEMGRGAKNAKIAEKLNISSKTLDIHRANVLRKLATKSVTELAKIFWFVTLVSKATGESPYLSADERKAQE